MPVAAAPRTTEHVNIRRAAEPRKASSSAQAAIATMQTKALTNQACASIRRRSYQRAKPRG